MKITILNGSPKGKTSVTMQYVHYETFEKRSILFKVKSKIPDFERGKTRISTTGIH